MKNKKYEVKSTRSHRGRFYSPPRVTRAKVFKAFSTPEIPHRALVEIVAKYIGDSTVPPSWSGAGVKGTFGKRIYSLWARHIAPLKIATYKNEDGRYITPVVQSIHDLEFGNKAKSKPVIEDVKYFVDEFSSFSQVPSLELRKMAGLK